MIASLLTALAAPSGSDSACWIVLVDEPKKPKSLIEK